MAVGDAPGGATGAAPAVLGAIAVAGLALSWLGWLTWNSGWSAPFAATTALLCLSPVAVRLVDLRMAPATGSVDGHRLTWRYLWAQVSAATSAVALGFLGLVGALVCFLTVPIAVAALTLAFTGTSSRRGAHAVIVGELVFVGAAIAATNLDERPILSFLLVLGSVIGAAWLLRCRAGVASSQVAMR